MKNGHPKDRDLAGSMPSSAAPNIPTIAESGLPGFSGNNWYGFVAPANTPKPIIDVLNNEIVRILNLPDVKETLTTMGAEVIGSPQPTFRI